MDLVDRDRRPPVIRRESFRTPCLGRRGGIRQRRHDGGGLRPALRRHRVRIGLQQDVPVTRLDLEFVKRARADAGQKDLPDADIMAESHRMDAAVPAVEIPDDADPLGVRGPDGEARSRDALHLSRMRAQLFVASEMSPLRQEMNVEIAEKRRKAIRVIYLVAVVSIDDLEPVGKALSILADFAGEETGRMNARDLDRQTVLDIFNNNALRRRQKGTDLDFRARRTDMHPKQGKRVPVIARKKGGYVLLQGIAG